MTDRPSIVLIHGLFGFRKLLWLEYFMGVRELLQSMGLRVVIPTLPWCGNIERRSRSLAEQLAGEAGPLHLVAHSMGGLDARAYITHLDGARHVASLTTLASPHHGSEAADHVCRTLSPFILFPGVRALTRGRTTLFNANTPNHPDIIYRSYSARRPLDEQPWIARRYGRVIQQAEGDNDSQVSVASAQWGEHLDTLYADHFELIGRNMWFNPLRSRRSFDHLPLYRDIGQWVLDQHATQKPADA